MELCEVHRHAMRMPELTKCEAPHAMQVRELSPSLTRMSTHRMRGCKVRGSSSLTQRQNMTRRVKPSLFYGKTRDRNCKIRNTPHTVVARYRNQNHKLDHDPGGQR